MKPKDIIIYVLLLTLAVTSYSLGNRSAKLRELEMRDARVRLIMNLGLYDAAQRGDLPKFQRDLGMFILGQTRTFEEQFGAPAADDPFAKRFTTARDIAAQVETNLVRFDSPKDLINALNKTNASPK